MVKINFIRRPVTIFFSLFLFIVIVFSNAAEWYYTMVFKIMEIQFIVFNDSYFIHIFWIKKKGEFKVSPHNLCGCIIV